jgi:predicted translin family RNA/ssDNA-binding protein
MAANGKQGTSQAMEDIFGRVSAVLAAQDETREMIRSARDVADTAVRTAQRALSSLHTAQGALADATAPILALLPPVGEAIAAIEAACPDEPGAFYQYSDIWRNVLQQSAYVCVLLEFVNRDTLASSERVVEMLGADVRMPLEDYLWGVIHAINDLPRLAMNRVTVADYTTPKRCVVFAANVFEAFKQMSFSNSSRGNLRPKFDSLKYNLDKLEQTMYAIDCMSIHCLHSHVHRASAYLLVSLRHASGHPQVRY